MDMDDDLMQLLMGAMSGGAALDPQKLMPFFMKKMQEKKATAPRQLTPFQPGFGLPLYAAQAQSVTAEVLQEAVNRVAFELPPPMPPPGQPLSEEQVTAIQQYNLRQEVRMAFFDILVLAIRQISIERQQHTQGSSQAAPTSLTS